MKKKKEELRVFHDLSDLFDYKPTLKERILWDLEYYFCKWPRDRYYDIRNGLFHRYDLIRTGLKKTSWWDKDHLMLYGMMNLLVDYVEGEKCFETIVWDQDDVSKDVKAKIEKIYNWWKQYPQQLKIEENALHQWCEFNRQKNKTETEKISEKRWWDELHELEAKREKEEQEMLHLLIDIRKFLWT